MRHLFLVVDMSQAMEDQDLKPTRLVSSLKVKYGYLYAQSGVVIGSEI